MNASALTIFAKEQQRKRKGCNGKATSTTMATTTTIPLDEVIRFKGAEFKGQARIPSEQQQVHPGEIFPRLLGSHPTEAPGVVSYRSMKVSGFPEMIERMRF